MGKYVVVDKEDPLVNYTFVDGGWTSEFPYFEGTLKECKQWILTRKSMWAYKDNEYVVWPSDKWYEDKAELEEDTSSWDFHGDYDTYGW